MEYSGLLNFLWGTGRLVGGFTGVMGERITVLSTGEPGDDGGVWLGAEIVVDGERRRGTVVVGFEAEIVQGYVGFGRSPRRHLGGLGGADIVLRVVDRSMPSVIGVGDELVPQIEYGIDPRLVEFYDTLRRGSKNQGCAEKITGMDPVRRVELLTSLLVRRLQRKTERIVEIFEATKRDWHQTFHVLLLQTMGGNKNTGAFTELAKRVTQTMLSREKGSSDNAEALLVGGAGFLHDAHDRDERVRKLAEAFVHLAAKYSIVPLRVAEWDITKLYPVNHPENRLRQIAALVCKRDFMLDGVLACRTSGDVERLFTLPPVPRGVALSSVAGSVGAGKARLVGINMVAPLMFAYGKQTGLEELCERAVDLLSTIPAENNSKLEWWYKRGCEAENAFDSQALLELHNEFCGGARCAECRLGRAELNAEIKKSVIFAVHNS